MRSMRAVVGIAIVAVAAAGGIAACGALLDLPALEVISDEAGTGPADAQKEAGGAEAGTDAPSDSAVDASCTDVNPVADWCARCGVGCTDAATCHIFPESCAAGGAFCCTNYQCKNGTCQACAGDGGACGGVSCCSPLRCRSTDNRC